MSTQSYGARQIYRLQNVLREVYLYYSRYNVEGPYKLIMLRAALRRSVPQRVKTAQQAAIPFSVVFI